MELGELVSVAIPGQSAESQCPFSHEKPNPTEKNELGGDGQTLGKNMEGGKGVHTSKPPFGGDYTKGSVDLDPRDRSSPKKFVYVTVKGQTVEVEGRRLPYPMTCAAHHLIPAQESMKGHPVLKFMCKDGEKQDFKNGKKEEPAAVPNSRVWGNVAYNVNGRQNGVWLPGNYAVGAGAGGVEVWKTRATDKRSTFSNAEAAANWERALDLGPDEWWPWSEDPVENEAPKPGALAAAVASAPVKDCLLAGTNYHIDSGNPKWAYVKAAMDEIGGQFHDRHVDYSKEVKDYLTKITEAYDKMYDRSTDEEDPCKQCEEAERPANAKKSLVGPPYGIVSRLVAGSDFFGRYVGVPTVKAVNIYTSKWVREWIATKHNYEE